MSAVDISTPYGRFTRAYASGAEREFSQEVARFALASAAEFAGAPRRALDIACGIGAACEVYAGAGLQTFGADGSADMIELAKAGAEAAGLSIDYHQSDMRSVTLPAPVDLVTCMYDSLNFMLTADDLATAFGCARRALVAGGSYLFDMYTLAGLAHTWGSQDQIHTVNEGHFVATRTCWRPETGTNTKQLWGFDRVGDGWLPWQEEHTSRGYPLPELDSLLETAGFQVRRRLDWSTGAAGATDTITPATTRVLYLATAR